MKFRNWLWLNSTVAAATLFCGLTVTTNAQAYNALAPKDPRATGALVLLDQSYQTDGNANFGVKGTLLHVGYEAPLGHRVTLGAGLGVLFDGQLTGDVRTKSGTGIRLGVAGDFSVMRSGANEVLAGLGVSQDRYNFKSGGVKTELTATDVVLSGLFRHHVGHLGLLGGLDVHLTDKGTLAASAAGFSGSTDFQRDGTLGLRLGLAADVDPNTALRVEVRLLGEQTVVLAADFRV